MLFLSGCISTRIITHATAASNSSMGFRTGAEFVESLRDGRTVYVNGERVNDVTTHPPFRGVVKTASEKIKKANGKAVSLRRRPG
jgi:hypothetical protein